LAKRVPPVPVRPWADLHSPAEGASPLFSFIRRPAYPGRRPFLPRYSGKKGTKKRRPLWRKRAPFVKLWVLPLTLYRGLGVGFRFAYFLRETAAAETRATAARAVAMPTTSLAPVSGLLSAAVVPMGRALSEKT
jgi:hypothetical protein